MSLDTTPARPTTSDRLARLVTEIFAPAVWAAAMPLIVVAGAGVGLLAAGGWGLLTVVFSAVIPYGVIWLGVRRGQLTDHHIGKREQRRKPLVFGLASVLTGLILLIVLDAPSQLVGLVLVMLAVLLAATAVNLKWKLSAHTAVSGASVTVLTLAYGWAPLGAFLLVAAIGWSRVKLRDHTTAQVIAGACLGVILAAAVFTPFA